MDDLVRPFSGWSKLPLGWILCCLHDFAYDEVSYVKFSELQPFVVILGHLLLVSHHLLRCFISYFVQAVQVDSQLIVVIVFIEGLSSHTSDSYFDLNYCLDAIGKPEGHLSCWGPRCSSVYP